MKKLKHLKTFEGLNRAEDAGLYDQMSDLLNRASEIYKEFSGEEYDFDPEDAVDSLEELTPDDPNYEEAQSLIDDIQDLEIQIDEADAEEYYDSMEDEYPDDVECPDCDGEGHYEDGEECERCEGTGREMRPWDIPPD